jgi:DNA-binding PadR family transcriptional regulator
MVGRTVYRGSEKGRERRDRLLRYVVILTKSVKECILEFRWPRNQSIESEKDETYEDIQIPTIVQQR